MKPAFALSLVLLVSGCAGGGAQQPPESPLLTRGWGLGIDTSNPPPLGPYLENASDLDALFGFLGEPKASTWLNQCAANPDSGALSTALRDSLRSALDLMDGHCAETPRGTRLPEVEDLSTHYNGLLVKATVAMGRERDALDRAMDRIGSIVDAEFVHAVTRLHDWNRVLYVQAGRGFEQFNPARPPEFDSRPVRDSGGPPIDTRFDLLLALEMLESIPRRADLHEALLATYPWSEGLCEKPESVGLLERVVRLRDEALTLARPHQNASGVEYGWLRDFFEDNPGQGHDFTYHALNGWWPSLLWHEMSLHHSVAYWRAFDEPDPLPSLEEARFLVAEFVAANHTLAVRDYAQPYASNLYPDADPDGQRQQINPRRALEVSVLKSVPWTFGTLVCP